MKSLIITDPGATIRVEFVTDLIAENARTFSVMDIKGLTALAITGFGINFGKKVYTIQQFEAFCTANSLNLFLVDYGVHATVPSATLVTSGYLYGPPLGVFGLE